MTHAKLVSQFRTITTYPFRCVFDLEVNGDVIKGALVGHLGKRVSECLKEGDNLTVQGHWIEEKSFGKIFIIENASLPKEAKTGRLANYYA